MPPALPEFADVGGEPATPPGPVAEAAGEIFGRFGTVEGVEAFRVGPHWRLVGSVTDPAGVRWPLVVWLDDAGRQVDPAR